MSNHHFRPRRTPGRSSEGKWIVSLIALAVAGAVLFMRVEVLLTRVETSPATIVDSRIVPAGTTSSNFGGVILYRIEVLARFEQNGTIETRWIPASPSSSDRATLQLQF